MGLQYGGRRARTKSGNRALVHVGGSVSGANCSAGSASGNGGTAAARAQSHARTERERGHFQSVVSRTGI